VKDKDLQKLNLPELLSPSSGEPRILFIGVWLLLARLSTNK